MSMSRVLAVTSMALWVSTGFYSTTSFADDTDNNKLSEYILNFGKYLGFDLDKSPQNVPSVTLIPKTLSSAAAYTTVWSYLGAIPVNTMVSNFKTFVPTSVISDSLLANLSNNSFRSYQSQAEPISINPLIDQAPYQKDPVSQAVVNTLATSDYTYCLKNYNSSTWDSKKCPTGIYTKGNKTNYQVMQNIIGSNVPSPSEFFSENYIQTQINHLAALNSNTLIAPLMYDTQKTSSGSDSAGASSFFSGAMGSTGGLTSKSQAETAANYIRYASGMVAPLELPAWSDYNDLYVKAISGKNDTPSFEAQGIIAQYLAKLRVYAAQTSVAINNLYFILSKRAPQQTGNPEQPLRSEALNDYQMASWRILDMTNSNNSNEGNWKQMINNASSATVQKEIAVLLAEINYQMYLSRQQQERILLTNSLIQLMVANMNKPDRDFSQSQSSSN